MINRPFITDDDVIEDESYNRIKEMIKCKLCNNILKEPMVCKGCQNVYCKKCIDNWSKNEDDCPNDCISPSYAISYDKAALLSMLNFLCQNCKKEIRYNDVESHLKAGCEKSLYQTKLFDAIYKKKKLKKLTSEEVSDVRKENKNVNHLSSKLIFIYFLIISYNLGQTTCWKVFFN